MSQQNNFHQNKKCNYIIFFFIFNPPLCFGFDEDCWWPVKLKMKKKKKINAELSTKFSVYGVLASLVIQDKCRSSAPAGTGSWPISAFDWLPFQLWGRAECALQRGSQAQTHHPQWCASHMAQKHSATPGSWPKHYINLLSHQNSCLYFHWSPPKDGRES